MILFPTGIALEELEDVAGDKGVGSFLACSHFFEEVSETDG